MTTDELQRITRLEVKFEHMNEKLDDTNAKVTAVHDLLLQAKGAKWVIVGTATIASGFTAFIVKFLPFLGNFPK